MKRNNTEFAPAFRRTTSTWCQAGRRAAVVAKAMMVWRCLKAG
ncbi:hypothetical protein SLEP1_g48256 [Rubroshorea leprosula]|uniref:Uncharacterized protein n=1 Tax=Rubroshorea leprosula TaxID=152421 RepID=A0AAV5LT36_9ROSI|nr:hypothetical protein SLEP1_g48256 [Rubroshorea leprosula]